MAWLTVGCQKTPTTVSLLVGGDTPVTCSQMHRDVSRWQGREIADCGPDVTGLIELTPIGNGFLLARKRFSPNDDLWSLTPLAAPDGPPTAINQSLGAATAGFTLLPGTPPRVLVYDPRQSRWDLYVTQTTIVNHSVLATSAGGQWPSGYWPLNQNGGPWDHQFIGLEDGNILDRDLGNGATRIWSVLSGSGGTSPTQLVASDTLTSGPRDQFRRGHRLVHLGGNRLLEWLPRPCSRH